MTLTRTTAGLLVFDHFTSDPTDNYTKYEVLPTTAWSQEGSLWSQTSVNVDAIQRRNSLTTAACVTFRTRLNSDNAFPICMCFTGDTTDGDNQLPCYRLFSSVGSTTLTLGKRYGGASVSIDTETITALAKDTYYLFRVYVASGVVYSKFGISALTVALSGNDSDITSGSGALRAGHQVSFDWHDIRTSHIVTCTNLPAGWKFKISDGTTTAQATESGGTATVDAGAILFPLANVQVLNDSDEVIETYTSLSDMGGGDTFQYAQTKTITITSDVYTKTFRV